MNDHVSDDAIFCERSAIRWERLARRTEVLAHRAAKFNTAVGEHLREVAYSHWKMATERRIEAFRKIGGVAIDLSLSPR